MSERPCHFSGGGRSAFDEEDDLARLDAQLALARAHDAPADADEVAEVHEVEDPVARLPHLVGAHVDLQLRLAVARASRTTPCRGRASSARGRRRARRAPGRRAPRASSRRRPATTSREAVRPLEARRVDSDAHRLESARLLEALGRLGRPARHGRCARRAPPATRRSFLPLSLRSSAASGAAPDLPPDRVEDAVHERRRVGLAEALRQLDRLVEDDRRGRLRLRQRARRRRGAGSVRSTAAIRSSRQLARPRRSPRRAPRRDRARRRPAARPSPASAAVPERTCQKRPVTRSIGSPLISHW